MHLFCLPMGGDVTMYLLNKITKLSGKQIKKLQPLLWVTAIEGLRNLKPECYTTEYKMMLDFCEKQELLSTKKQLLKKCKTLHPTSQGGRGVAGQPL